MHRLTLARDARCRRCGLPMVLEWTCMFLPDGFTHNNCSGPGDSSDVARALPWLSDDDREYLDAAIADANSGA